MAAIPMDLTENKGDCLVATCVALLATSWLSIGLRMYTRVGLMKTNQSDDWLMMIAQSLFTIACAFTLAGVHKGLGKHNAAVTDQEDRVDALMWQALTIIVYIPCMLFVKLSVGVFLLRLATRTLYAWTIRIALIIVTLWTMGIFFWNLFQCMPVERQWDDRIPQGHCVSSHEIVSAAYALSVLNVLSDWFFALLPIPMLWGVKMTKQTKTTVIVILGLGVFASIATLIRVKFLADLENFNDLLYSVTDAYVWTLVEPGVAIIASSLATVRPLLRCLKIRGFVSTDQSTSQSSGTDLSDPERYIPGSPNARRPMPSHGPNNVSLLSVPANADGHIGLTMDQKHKSANGGGGGGGVHANTSRKDVKSEILLIEGNEPFPTWDSPSSNRSMNNLVDLESHGREYQSRRGWGVQ